MDLVTGIKERRSVRRFADMSVPRELIKEVVDTARYAPSWKNTQIARYIVVDDKEKIAAMANEKCTYGFEYNIKTIAKAPAVVVLTFVEGRSGFEKMAAIPLRRATDGRCLMPALQLRLSALQHTKKVWEALCLDILTRKN